MILMTNLLIPFDLIGSTKNMLQLFNNVNNSNNSFSSNNSNNNNNNPLPLTTTPTTHLDPNVKYRNLQEVILDMDIKRGSEKRGRGRERGLRIEGVMRRVKEVVVVGGRNMVIGMVVVVGMIEHGERAFQAGF